MDQDADALEFDEGDAIAKAWTLKRIQGDRRAYAAVFVVRHQDQTIDIYVWAGVLRRKRNFPEMQIPVFMDDMRSANQQLPEPCEWEAVDLTGAASIPSQILLLRAAGVPISLGHPEGNV